MIEWAHFLGLLFLVSVHPLGKLRMVWPSTDGTPKCTSSRWNTSGRPTDHIFGSSANDLRLSS